MHEQKDSVGAMQKDQYERKKNKWEDERCNSFCAGCTYLVFGCVGCLCWRQCWKDYRQLRADALELRGTGMSVDNSQCPAGCGWCAPLCFRENKVVPIERREK